METKQGLCMTLEDMKEIKQFAKSMGYIIREDWGENLFTARFPLSHSIYCTVLDFSYTDAKAVNLSDIPVERIITDDYRGSTKFYIEDLRKTTVINFLCQKWKEYKELIGEKKLEQIQSDFN